MRSSVPRASRSPFPSSRKPKRRTTGAGRRSPLRWLILRHWKLDAVRRGKSTGQHLIHPDQWADCCATPGSSSRNATDTSTLAAAGGAIDRWSPTKPAPAELYGICAQEELLCLGILWNGSGNAAHFTTICGCTDPSDGDDFIVSTSDTLPGFHGSTLAYSDFPAQYHGGGMWTDTFLTKGGLAATEPAGQADLAEIATNNNDLALSIRPRRVVYYRKFDTWIALAARSPGAWQRKSATAFVAARRSTMPAPALSPIRSGKLWCIGPVN